MANSVDSDQTPQAAASDLGQHCLQKPICPNTKGYYGIQKEIFPYCDSFGSQQETYSDCDLDLMMSGGLDCLPQVVNKGLLMLLWLYAPWSQFMMCRD